MDNDFNQINFLIYLAQKLAYVIKDIYGLTCRSMFHLKINYLEANTNVLFETEYIIYYYFLLNQGSQVY